eukprot:TRINITY_DN2836_c0_g1_i7.p1 TRINITY_DN2836_c0_g1~~TRINITY_DN2836_c0_g1_i7.p1  ORF type:complete len:658 (-),score=120.10 TRINITY_DN2836_c0_g1_i7:221-1966(-)
MDNLQEVITCSDFHPTSCNLFIYSTSKGGLRLGDLRDSSLCDRHSKEFTHSGGEVGGFFQELVTTISNCKFSPNGYFIASRDYLSMKIWDVRKEKGPLRTIKFHDHLIPKLCDLYESESIFDKFQCAWSGCSLQMLSGSYNGNFYVCSAFGKQWYQRRVREFSVRKMSQGEDEFLASANFRDLSEQWEFSQMFGEGDDPEGSEEGNDNWISSLSFDRSGKYLAVGYHGGQVVVLYQQDELTYQLCCEFKSHDSEFDCLTSTEIEEKINTIRWYPFNDRNPQVMTCNDKTIKLFRVVLSGDVSEPALVRPRKIFQGGHAYNINSLSFNSDGETFISADDLRINLWNIEISNEAFGVVDIKPDNMDNLQEVITCSDFHPTSCNLFIYSTSKGGLRLGDLRDSSLCDRHSKEFTHSGGEVGGFFQELVTTISNCKFSPNGYFIASRDYLSMKIWDVRKEKGPLRTIKFHDHLIPKLCDLYESESIFDKFQCAWSGCSLQMLSGSYNGNFYVCSAFGTNSITKMTLKAGNHNWGGDYLDTTQKVLYVDWHPSQDVVALGARDYGYLYIRKPEGCCTDEESSSESQ